MHVETERCSRKAERYTIYPQQSAFRTSSIPHFPRCHGVLALVRLFRNPKTFRRRLKAPCVELKHRTLAVCASALEDSDGLIWVPRLRHGSSLCARLFLVDTRISLSLLFLHVDLPRNCVGFLGEEEGGVQTLDSWGQPDLDNKNLRDTQTYHDPSFSRLRIHIRADQTPVSLVSPARTSEAWP